MMVYNARVSGERSFPGASALAVMAAHVHDEEVKPKQQALGRTEASWRFINGLTHTMTWRRICMDGGFEYIGILLVGNLKDKFFG